MTIILMVKKLEHDIQLIGMQYDFKLVPINDWKKTLWVENY